MGMYLPVGLREVMNFVILYFYNYSLYEYSREY